MFKLPITLISISTLILAGCSGTKTSAKAEAVGKTSIVKITPKETSKTNQVIKKELQKFEQKLTKLKGELELYIKKTTSSTLKNKLNGSLEQYASITNTINELNEHIKKDSKEEDTLVITTLELLNDLLDETILKIETDKASLKKE